MKKIFGLLLLLSNSIFSQIVVNGKITDKVGNAISKASVLLYKKSTDDIITYFISDNNGYDWQFINWYFHHFTGANPFGFSSANLGSLYKGLVGNMRDNFKHLRKTKHTHHPVDDAKGNAEALLTMHKDMGLDISL